MGVVTCVDISKSGKYIVSGSCDTTVCLWDVDMDKVHSVSQKAPVRKIRTLTGHDDEVFFSLFFLFYLFIYFLISFLI